MNDNNIIRYAKFLLLGNDLKVTIFNMIVRKFYARNYEEAEITIPTFLDSIKEEYFILSFDIRIDESPEVSALIISIITIFDEKFEISV